MDSRSWSLTIPAMRTMPSGAWTAAIFDGRRLQVEAARGPKRGGGSGVGGRSRGGYRVTVEGLASRTSWQDLKDFARVAGSVAFTDVYVERGKKTGVIEYSSYDDMQEALRKLDDTKLDDVYVRLYPEKGSEGDRGSSGGSGGGGSSRSNGDRGRSPARRSPPRARSRSPRRTEERKDDRARSRSPRRASSRDRAPPARAKSRSPVRREDDKRDDRDDRSRDPPKKEEPAAASPRRD